VKYEDLTREIIRACYVVSNDLGSGFVESVYHRALNVALEERGLLAQSSVPLEVRFHNHVVGEFVADMIVNGSVLLELKAVTALRPEHQAQVINYLNATGVEVGLLVNFGRPKPEVRRCTRGTNGTRWATAQIV
jgi:GxxExxY protein